MKRILCFLILLLVGCGSQNSNQTSPKIVSDDTVSSDTYCSKVDAGSGVSVYLQFEVVSYSSGDKLVSCSVSLPAGEYSNTEVFKSGSVAANSPSCIVAADIDAVTGGFWDFTTSPTQTKYIDGGSAHNNYIYSFLAGDCGSI